jgi:large subunit ribosomal protein L24
MANTPASKQKLHVRKGDNVKILTGKDKGKEGRILEIVKKTDKHTREVQYRAIVEGLNIVHKHKKPVDTNNPGSKIETEASIHISNLAVLDPKSGAATRVGRKKANKGWVRYSKKSGEIIK